MPESGRTSGNWSFSMVGLYRRAAAGLAGLGVLSAAARATVFDVQLDNSLVGRVLQSNVPASNGPSGVNSCTPTATANAFAFLQNEYPTAYGNSLVGGGTLSE